MYGKFMSLFKECIVTNSNLFDEKMIGKNCHALHSKTEGSPSNLINKLQRLLAGKSYPNIFFQNYAA